VGVTWCLVIGAEKTAKRQLRAYVALNTIEHEETTARDGQRWVDDKIKIRIQNYGQTPAHHVSVVQTCSEAPREDTYRHPPTTDSDQLGNQMLHPGQAFNHIVVYKNARHECLDRVIDVGLHQKSVFYVYGRID